MDTLAPVHAFLRYLQYEKRYSAHTLQAYRTDLEQVTSFLHNTLHINLLQASPTALRSWILHIAQQKQQPRSVNRKIATLKSCFKFLLARNILPTNPTLKLHALKTPKPIPPFVKEQEMNLILDHNPYPDNLQGKRDKLLLELLYGTGMRRSELIKLQDKDFDPQQRLLKVQGKRNKERYIPIPKNLVHSLSDYIKAKKEHFQTTSTPALLLTDKGQALYESLVYRIVKQYLNLSVVSKKSPHVLRHTYATHLLNKGADLNAIKELLGHSSLAATQVYTHNTLERIKKIYKQAHPKA